ncbi:MAG TPA: sulfite exporter TauE/SafE family protein [Burkholderiales bacterium]
MDSFAPGLLVAAALIAAVAGVIRGITGFGGAMVMTPPFALMFGPWLAVPIGLILESLVALPMVFQTRHLVRWRLIGPMCLAAVLAVPLGVQVLVSVDPLLLRRAIAGTVIVFSLLLFVGWRHAGAPRIGTSVGLGAVSGAMIGSVGMGAPPVILYLLSGPDPIERTRANVNLYLVIGSLAAIAVLLGHGVLDPEALWLCLLLTPGYYAGLVLGVRLFSHFGDTKFRQFVLVLLIAVSTGILLA